MIKLYTLFILFSGLSVTYVHGQYCLLVGPSQVVDSNIESFAINGESATSINYAGCPGIINLEDLTATESVDLIAGNAYTLNVQFGTCTGNWAGVGEAWIDYNLDGLFDPSESIGTWTGTPPSALSVFNFTVPSGSANGVTRLRIMQWEGGTLPLDPCGTYAWGSVVDVEVNLSGGTGGSGGPLYCSGGPALTADSNLSSALLNGESGTQINFTGCPGVIGLDDQTNTQTVTLGEGMSYSFDLTFGTCLGTYPGVGEAWIDYNMDNFFQASESIGTWSGTPPASINFNFTVPIGVVYDTSRIRVMHAEGGVLPLDPCASFNWGSVTDFEVIFQAGVDCSSYFGDDFDDFRPVASLPFTENHSTAVCYNNKNTVYNSPDVFYRLILADYPVSQLTISLCGSSFDTYLSVLNVDSNVVDYNDDFSLCGSQSEINLNTLGYDTLFVVVEGWGNNKGDYIININESSDVGVDNSNTQYFSIYPNPVIGELNIEGFVNGTQVTISNVSGEIVIQKDQLDKNYIDVSELTPGIYFIRIEKEGEILSQKFIKQ